MLTYLEVFARYAGYLTGISAAIVILIKPLREWVFGQKAEREALKCLLRQDMLSTYYKCKDEDKIRQYEAENFVMEYKAYKGLHGNSFIDDIAAAERKWEIIT
jgi:hypothetical protein